VLGRPSRTAPPNGRRKRRPCEGNCNVTAQRVAEGLGGLRFIRRRARLPHFALRAATFILALAVVSQHPLRAEPLHLVTTAATAGFPLVAAGAVALLVTEPGGVLAQLGIGPKAAPAP